MDVRRKQVVCVNKGILRTLVGKIDGVFAAGLYTDEDREQRRKFDDSFKEEAAFVGRSFVFDRTSVLHLRKDQYLLTVEPTELAWGRIKVQDTPPAEAVEMFGLERIEENAEILIIPPCQTNIEEYVQATESRYNKLPHVAFWTVTRFADNVNWAIAEYNPGMPNLMGMEGGAL